MVIELKLLDYKLKTIYAIKHSFECACMCIEIEPNLVERWINKDSVFEYNYNYLMKRQIN